MKMREHVRRAPYRSSGTESAGGETATEFERGTDRRTLGGSDSHRGFDFGACGASQGLETAEGFEQGGRDSEGIGSAAAGAKQ